MKCDCNKLQQRVSVYSCEADMPLDLKERLQGCPKCMTEWKAHCQTAKLISLKRYEHPDELTFLRSRTAVRRQINGWQSSIGYTVWGQWGAFMRVSAAALIMGMVFLYFQGSSESPIAQSVEQDGTPAEPGLEYLNIRMAEERPNPEVPLEWLATWAPNNQPDSGFQLIGHEP